MAILITGQWSLTNACRIEMQQVSLFWNMEYFSYQFIKLLLIYLGDSTSQFDRLFNSTSYFPWKLEVSRCSSLEGLSEQQSELDQPSGYLKKKHQLSWNNNKTIV